MFVVSETFLIASKFICREEIRPCRASMSLIQLSNELLSHIVDYIIPEEFEAVILTCRRLCTIATRYKTIRATYHTVEPGKGKHPSALLLDIWQNSGAARWVKTAKFHIPPFVDNDPIPMYRRPETRRDLELAIHDLATVPSTSLEPLLPESEHVILHSVSEEFSSGGIFALLLTMFQNVETLKFNAASADQYYGLAQLFSSSFDALRSITNPKRVQLHQSDSKSPKLPLGNLKNVYLIGEDPALWPVLHILLCELLGLPSLKKVSVRQDFSRYLLFFPNFTDLYGIEELEILCPFSLHHNFSRLWIDIFPQTPCLRRFTHSFEPETGRWVGSRTSGIRHWPVDILIQSLTANVQSTLEELSLTICARSWDHDITHAGTGSLRDLMHLRSLEVSADLLLSEKGGLVPHSHFSEERVMQELPPPGEQPSGAPHALESLPSNLQELRLVFEGGFGRAREFQTMFAGVHKFKRLLLPKLAKVTLCYSHKMDVIVERIANDLRTADVEVTVDLQEQPRPLHECMNAM